MSRPVLTASVLAMTAAPITLVWPAQAQTASLPIFVKMEEITVPIVDASRMDGILRVSIILQAGDTENAARINRHIPELRAAAIAALLEFGRLYASPFTSVDVGKLAHMLDPALRRADAGIVKTLIVRVSARTG